jgi:antirestriction protein ArdC
MSFQDKLRQDITDKIVASLEKGVSPWRRPWSGGGMPTNVASKKHYRGINILLLALHQDRLNLKSTVYGTFNQWKQLGCMVKKRPGDVKEGQWGSAIVFYSPIKKTKTLANGEEREYSFPLLRTYTVFAADQVEGAEKYLPEARNNDIPSHDTADKILKDSGATINHGGDRAFYRPSEDTITLPERCRFECVNSYYGTALHELAHWTGHESRLNRLDKLARFGSQTYAVEELVAEIAGCYLLGAVGLPVLAKLENHVSYLANWLQVLKSDSKAIFQATAAASSAADYCLKLAGMAEHPEEEAIAV